MPEEEKKTVDIDTSGPEVDIDIEQPKEEGVVEQPEQPEQEKETDKTYENERETKLEEGGEVKQEKKEDDKLEDYSKGVQARIAKLTRKMREAERREKAALDYARGLKSQLDDTKNRFSKTSKSYIEQFSARVVAEQEDAKKALRDAIADQDADKIAEANSRIAQLAVEAEKVKMTQAEEEAIEEKAKAEAKVEQPIQQAPQTNVAQPSGKAKEWAEKNEWFGSDKIMTSAAFQAHNDLVEQGFDAESDEYYNEIDKVMKENFPHKFSQPQEQKKPVQTVASAQRNQTGRRSVKLTKSQIVIAKKLGVPLEEYAKYVKENANG